eukprot:42193-Chlamydomonas_euryale.AAC.1
MPRLHTCLHTPVSTPVQLAELHEQLARAVDESVDSAALRTQVLQLEAQIGSLQVWTVWTGEPPYARRCSGQTLGRTEKGLRGVKGVAWWGVHGGEYTWEGRREG